SGRFYITAASTFNMSGGDINVATVGNTTTTSASFGFSSISSVFIMSGGNINIINPSTGTTPYDVNVATTSPSITGGSINFGGTGTPPNSIFSGFRGKVPNMTVRSGHTARIQTTNPAILGDLTIE